MLELRISRKGETHETVIRGAEAVLGRSSRSEIALGDLALSRQHARFFADGLRWCVEDLGSRNGTYINSQRIAVPTPVEVGDIITAGATVLEVLTIDVSTGSASSTSPASPASTGTPDARAQDAMADQPSVSLPMSAWQLAAGTTGWDQEIDEADRLPSETVLRPVADLLEDSAEGGPHEAEAGEAALARTVARLKMLNEVHNALGRSVELDELLELILERAFNHLKPGHGVILLRQPSGGYRPAASRGAPPPGSGLPTSQSLIHEVAEKGLAALVLDTRTDLRFSASTSLISSGIRSLLAAPLLSPEGPLGLIILWSNAAIRQFTEEDLALLVSLASVAALRLRNVRLTEAAAERQLLGKELELARRIQAALFPETLPEIPGYCLDACNLPSRGVSGDLYLVVQREAGRVADGAAARQAAGGPNPSVSEAPQVEHAFLVADVSGKGISASLLTASIEALAVGPIEDGLEPAVICDRLSERLYRRTPPERFATAFLAVLEPEHGRIRYASAGHTPALLARASGSIEWLPATGTPLGLIDRSTFKQSTTTLEPGDLLLLYTDGLTEASNTQGEEYGEEYGEERLAEVVRAHRHQPARAVIEAVTADIDRYAGELATGDDRTMVVLQRLPEKKCSAPDEPPN